MTIAHEVVTVAERQVPWVNASGLSVELVEPGVREIAAQLSQWVTDSRTTARGGSMFNRTAYIAPDNYYDQVRIARNATRNDDVVGGLADTTEGLIFQGLQWESANSDEADIFNQLAGRQNLDAVMREAYRTLYTDSQVVFATWWDFQEFRIRGRNSSKIEQPDGTVGVRRGPRRRKRAPVYCPTRIAILDNLKIVPIGNRMWGQDRLAWQASEAEAAAYAELRLDPAAPSDPTMLRLFIGGYTPTTAEAARIADMGGDPRYLLELNPEFVWRHTLTKPTYQTHPDVRLASVFRHLDLKQQLMEADRVNLVGAANYILLVKKGSDTAPAQQPELDNLRENFNTIARLPVIISDHRLNIEIITPDQDLVLQAAKYDTLDRRILSRIVGALSVGANNRADDTLVLSRGIARLLENRRHMLKRTLERHIARAVVDHPNNDFETEPNLAFTPRNVQLDADNQIVQAVMAARTQKEISRKSFLEYFGFDQEVEAQRREVEAAEYDPIFGTIIPFSSPQTQNSGGTPAVAPQITGAQGGRPSGGGNPSADATNPQPRNRTPERASKPDDPKPDVTE